MPTGNALFFYDMLWDATDINKEMHGSCLNKFQEKISCCKYNCKTLTVSFTNTFLLGNLEWLVKMEFTTNMKLRWYKNGDDIKGVVKFNLEENLKCMGQCILFINEYEKDYNYSLSLTLINLWL